VTAAVERVDEITRQAQAAAPGRALLTALAALLYVVGWVPAKVCLAVVWAAVAVKVGWRDAWGKTRTDNNE
jgi:hypothetical protein